MTEITEYAAEYGVKVIEDAAHAFPIKAGNKWVGTIGEIGVFSFYSSEDREGCGEGSSSTGLFYTMFRGNQPLFLVQLLFFQDVEDLLQLFQPKSSLFIGQDQGRVDANDRVGDHQDHPFFQS